MITKRRFLKTLCLICVGVFTGNSVLSVSTEPEKDEESSALCSVSHSVSSFDKLGTSKLSRESLNETRRLMLKWKNQDK
jgi:hypothetical protein